MSQVLKTLEKFGLSENEARVYVQILKDNETSPFQLARETGIPRTTVYELIMSLSLKGLIGLERSNGLTKQQTKIKSKNPSVLRQILWDRRRELSGLEVDIVDILPALKGDYHKEEPNADFRFFPGIEGAKTVYQMEDEGDQQSYIWDYETPMDSFGRDFINEMVARYAKRIKTKKYRTKELFPLTDWTRHVTTYQYGRDPGYIKDREFRYLDNGIFDLKMRFTIKGRRVFMTNIEGGEMWGMVVNSQVMSNSLRSIFLTVWALGVPVTEEVVKSWGEDEFLTEEKKKRHN